VNIKLNIQINKIFNLTVMLQPIKLSALGANSFGPEISLCQIYQTNHEVRVQSNISSKFRNMGRRKLFRYGYLAQIILIVIMAGLSDSAWAQSIRPVSLMCEYQVDPLAIDIPNPGLSWKLETAIPGLRGLKQTSYQILVASNPAALASDKGDLWDSGQVFSDRNTHVIYNGVILKSLARCYWKVRVGDNEGNLSAWSTVATWSTGFLNQTDWQGKWIGSKLYPEQEPRVKRNGFHSENSAVQDVDKWVQIDLGNKLTIDKIILHPALPMEYSDGRPVYRYPGFGFPVRFRIDVSDNSDFLDYTTVEDYTKTDYNDPGNKAVLFHCSSEKAQFVRITATRLKGSNRGSEPFCFALGEMQVFSAEENVALNKAAKSSDSQEGHGWGIDKLTDGLNLIGESEVNHEALYLRKESEIGKPVQAATAYISGLGYFELYVNGGRVGDHKLDPGFTDYTRTALYVAHDITEMVKTGRNTLGIILGGGWYNVATPDAWGYHSAQWNSPPKVLIDVVIDYRDGTREIISSGETWEYSTGPVIFNCVRGGEVYDARKEMPGWNLAGFDDSSWRKARVVHPPAGKLVSQKQPPIRATKTITPVGLTEPVPGVYVFDLGVNISGWAKMEISGERGDTVSLFLCEHLNPDGTVRFGPHAWWHYGPYQTDKFICSGKGKELYEPRFTYHGFRYVQVEGLKNKPALDDLNGIWVHTDPQTAGEFECSNQDINKMQELILRTQLNNLHSIPTDCPHREKIGWLGDALVTMEEAMCNFDMATFYTKWYNDILDAQEADGHVPPIVPNPGWLWSTSSKNPPGVIPAFSDPWWGGAVLITPWNIYRYYGDIRPLEKGYDSIKSI
jgi:alpha-L-rhamnosidase